MVVSSVAAVGPPGTHGDRSRDAAATLKLAKLNRMLRGANPRGPNFQDGETAKPAVEEPGGISAIWETEGMRFGQAHLSLSRDL